MTGRGLQGRRESRLILFIAGVLGVIALSIVAFPPNMMGPQPEIVTPVTVSAAIVYLLGLGRMIAIYRATFESSRSSFRATRR